jgi:DNA-binding MarR family transcriptional regulator
METIVKFLEFAESLKLVRKADPEFEGNSIIEDIYTDLLPNNGIINKVNLPRTTILIGRKGTGKSTIFLKSQKDLDKVKRNLTIYIDAKSIYDNSTPTLPPEFQKFPSDEITKYLIYSNLIKEVIVRTKEKIKKRLSENTFKEFIGINDFQFEEVSLQLDEIENSIDEVFKNLNTSLLTSFKNMIETKDAQNARLEVGISQSGAKFKGKLSDLQKETIKREFDTALLTYLDIKKCLINNLLKIRDITKVKHLFIYLDDFSEINKDPQKLFMDWFIAPVNNLSEDFVKFKIAVYPKRFYYGLLDLAKIDEISLDFFDAFYSHEKKTDSSDISKMEQLALDYTKRLVNNRLNIYFPENNWLQYFNMTEDVLYQMLFKVSLNLPRKMGYILSFCYESCLIYKVPISISAIENASLRYYNDIVEKYFLVNEHVCKPFDDRISDAHHYDLLKQIIQKQVNNNVVLKRRKIKYTSHFLINNDLAYLLSNLELNGFISTYNKIKDGNNVFSTVYCLDYGLCKKFSLEFGSPKTKDFEKSFSFQIFNFNNVIVDFFNSTQVIKCEHGHEFPYSEINEFRKFRMSCPICLDSGKVSVCSVSLKYTELKERFHEREKSKSFKISFPEFLILDFLRLTNKPIPIKLICEITDLSNSTVSIRLDSLLSKNLIEHDLAATKQLGKEFVIITEKGIKTAKKIDDIISKLKIEKTGTTL